MNRHPEAIDRQLHTLTLATIRAGRRAAAADLSPQARESSCIHALSLAKSAFAAAMWNGIDVAPVFAPARATDRVWRHNRNRTITEALRACYAAIEALQCD